MILGNRLINKCDPCEYQPHERKLHCVVFLLISSVLSVVFCCYILLKNSAVVGNISC